MTRIQPRVTEHWRQKKESQAKKKAGGLQELEKTGDKFSPRVSGKDEALTTFLFLAIDTHVKFLVQRTVK